MTDPPAVSKWETKDFAFDFGLSLPKHIPRAWERAPKSSHVARHKGRKVWKRLDVRPVATDEQDVNSAGDERHALGEVSGNTPRAIKKLRVKDGQEVEIEGDEPFRSFTTLVERPEGTPKRKQVRHERDTQAPSERKRQPLPRRRKATRLSENLKAPYQISDQALLEKIRGKPEGSRAVAGKDAGVAMEHPKGRRRTASPLKNPASFRLPGSFKATKSAMSNPSKSANEDCTKVEPLIDFGTTSSPMKEQTKSAQEPAAAATPTATRPTKSHPSAKKTPIKPELRNIISPNLIDLESPQIGTTLLRRESLRRRESPPARTDKRRTKSPKKKQLKKRDTLQEREILQKFTECSTDDTEKQQGEEEVGEKGTVVVDAGSGGISEPLDAPTSREGDDGGDRAYAAKEQDDTVAIEPVAVPEHPQVEPEQQDVEPEQAQQPDEPAPEEEQSNTNTQQARSTRSGSRISDDTSVLKDFLSRAQARKAAKSVLSSPNVPKSLRSPPKRSPRKSSRPPLGRAATTPADHVESKSSSSSNSGKKERRRTCPPGEAAALLKQEPEPEPEDDINSTAPSNDEGQAPCRRSTRTRLPAPAKQPPTSLIPVRRADGADPVVVQRSQAQELALVTRTNTRRNKGQAKPPAFALLEILSSDDETDGSSVTRNESSERKAVTWAETLASYDTDDTPQSQQPSQAQTQPQAQQGQAQTQVSMPQQRTPKVRRMRAPPAPVPVPVSVAVSTSASSSAATPSASTTAGKKRSAPASSIPSSTSTSNSTSTSGSGLATANGTPAPKRRGTRMRVH